MRKKTEDLTLRLTGAGLLSPACGRGMRFHRISLELPLAIITRYLGAHYLPYGRYWYMQIGKKF
jgi:hypothetical protein